jgi:hypothetical protein
MTGIADKADSGRDVVRAGEAEAQSYRIESEDLTEASAIGDSDGFPQFGDFLDVTAVDADGDDLGPRWVECPADLARQLVEQDLAADGSVFVVESATKTQDGAWSFEVSDGA